MKKYRWPLILLGSVALIAAFAVGFLAHDAAVTTTVGLGNDLAPLAPSTSARVLDDKKVAQTIFRDRCIGDITVSLAPLEGGQAGLSSWTTSSATRVYANCTIIVSNNRPWSAEILCAIIVHEYGHLAGVEHSTNPRSIMYPRLSSRNIPDRCSERTEAPH